MSRVIYCKENLNGGYFGDEGDLHEERWKWWEGCKGKRGRVRWVGGWCGVCDIGGRGAGKRENGMKRIGNRGWVIGDEGNNRDIGCRV